MRSILNIFFSFLLITYLNVSAEMSDRQLFTTSSRSCAIADTNKMLKPIPKGLIVSNPVSDSDVLVVNSRCVVHTKYSESELIEMEKNFESADKWVAFYDDYSFSNDDVSMYICERSMVYTASEKKYVQFIMATGEKITIDRKKSAGKLFFFNPATGVRQCASSDFDQREYENF
jgi:quinolinate synthase